VWRLQADPTSSIVVTSHTGVAARPADDAFLDESGRLFVVCDLGLGIVHTLDVGVASELVERGVWRPQEIAFSVLVERFAIRLSPASTRT